MYYIYKTHPQGYASQEAPHRLHSLNSTLAPAACPSTVLLIADSIYSWWSSILRMDRTSLCPCPACFSSEIMCVKKALKTLKHVLW